ncbi:hypothetical protein [Caballeronia grimmiae]|uniref:hypothetical protein n=1 Tax=Caballeronia grimmiae TaxID=1071679 RepID=UPI0038BCD98B
MSFDGSASHGFGFLDQTDHKVLPAERLAAFTQFAKIFMSTHDIAPLDAAHARRVMWFLAPPSLGFLKPTVVLFMVVARDDQPFGLVFTSLAPDIALRRVAPSTLESQMAVFTADGRVIGGDDTEYTRYANARLGKGQTGSYHWLPNQGWGMRLEPLALDIGYIVAALPLETRLASQREPAIVIVLVTAALIAMLIAMYRYWNYRFLTRTYEHACRAVEGEILNHLFVHATPVGLCIALRSDFSVFAANQVARSVLERRIHVQARRAVRSAGSERHCAGSGRPGSDDPAASVFAREAERREGASQDLVCVGGGEQDRRALLCAIADISEHHEAERLLRAAKETSDAAAKAKLSFFASMSHEIRTPLSSLVGNWSSSRSGRSPPNRKRASMRCRHPRARCCRW